MNICEQLKHIRKLDQMIDAKLAERDRLKAIATDISSKPIDGMPYSNTGIVSQKMQNAIVNLVMIENELNEMIDQYVDSRQKIITLLEKLPEKEYGVLHRYYIRRMTWEQVAEDMGYCTMQVWRIKKKAMLLLNVIYECDKMVL